MASRKRDASAICQYCKKEFLTFKSEINRGKSKYCSISCGVSVKNKLNLLPVHENFFRKISKQSNEKDCWLYISEERYGKISVGRMTLLAHRYSYELHIGKIPKGFYVCHKCDVTLCVNPKHLFLGTSKDNTQDMLIKKRGNHRKGSKHHWSQLNEDQVLEIKKKLFKREKVRILAKEYNVSYSVIDQIRSGKSWNHVKWPEI